MIMQETLKEMVQLAIPYEHELQNINCEVINLITKYPELEKHFSNLICERKDWVDEVEKFGKVYLIFNKTFNKDRMNFSPPTIRVGLIGQNRKPTISVDF